MNPLDAIAAAANRNSSGLASEGTGGRIPGILTGIVSNNKDPDGLGRVKVTLPILGVDGEAKDTSQPGIETDWAPVASFYAGAKHGGYFTPEVKDEVLVGFFLGDINRPFVLGALYNGKDRPLQKNDNGKNDIKQIVTRSGLTVRLNDASGAETIQIFDEENKEQITISKKDRRITIQSEKEILLTSSGGAVTVSAKNIKVKAESSLNLEGGQVTIKSSGALNLEGGVVNVKSNGLVAVKGSTINLN